MEQAMLWLPGWGMADSVWDTIRSRLPEFRHFAPDYSQVTHPDHFWEAVWQKVLPLGSEHLHVVGWSMGGMLAQRLASVHPVSSLVLISTTARFVHPRQERANGWTKAHLQRMQRAVAAGREQVMASFVSALPSEKERRHEALLQEAAGAEWTTEALLAGLSFLGEEDCNGVLDSISCPTLVIHGADDEICPLPAGESLASSIEKAAFLPLADCGHAPVIFHSVTVAAAIRRMVGNSGEDGHQTTI